MKTNCFFSS